MSYEDWEPTYEELKKQQEELELTTSNKIVIFLLLASGVFLLSLITGNWLAYVMLLFIIFFFD